MKKNILIILALAATITATKAQLDTTYMYIMKSGVVKGKFKLSDLDSIIFYNPLSGQAGTVSDIDGNVYQTVTIFGSTWMKQNLNVSKLNDGTPIDNLETDDDWVSTTDPAFCWYDNDSATYGPTYGKLYNWYTVHTEKLCPVGWHVPTKEEWQALDDSCGVNGLGQRIAGLMLKETGTQHWKFNSSITATNETGFTALPGGQRFSDGTYKYITERAEFWSGSEWNSTSAAGWEIRYDNSDISLVTYLYRAGFSVRCVKN